MTIRTATLRNGARRLGTRPTSFHGMHPHPKNMPATSYITPGGIILALALTMILALAVWSHISIKNVSERVGLLEKESVRLAEEYKALLAEEAGLAESKALQKAGKNLGLRPPKEDEIIRMAN